MQLNKKAFNKIRIEDVVILLLAVALSFYVVEKSMQSMFVGEGYIWVPGTTAEFKPNSIVLPGVGGVSEFRINNHGYRGSNEYTDNVILTLGGSTTECLYLDQTETWSQKLEYLLNQQNVQYTIWNGGKSGKNSFDHIHDLSLVIDSIPNLKYVVVLMGVNDFLYSISGKDYLNLDKPWYKKTYIYKGASKFKNRFVYPQESTELDYEGFVYQKWRKHRHQAKQIFDTLPDLTEELNLFTENMSHLKDIANEHGAKIVFLTQPTIWRDNLNPYETSLLWMGGTVGFQQGNAAGYYSSSALQKGMRLFNDALIKYCMLNKVKCIDIESSLPKNTSIFYDDCHLNENGSYKVSELVYKGFK